MVCAPHFLIKPWIGAVAAPQCLQRSLVWLWQQRACSTHHYTQYPCLCTLPASTLALLGACWGNIKGDQSLQGCHQHTPGQIGRCWQGYSSSGLSMRHQPQAAGSAGCCLVLGYRASLRAIFTPKIVTACGPAGCNCCHQPSGSILCAGRTLGRCQPRPAAQALGPCLPVWLTHNMPCTTRLA